MTWSNMPTRQELEQMDAETVILPLVNEGQEDILVILDEECAQAVHFLTATRALAYAERLISLVRQHEPARVPTEETRADT